MFANPSPRTRTSRAVYRSSGHAGSPDPANYVFVGNSRYTPDATLAFQFFHFEDVLDFFESVRLGVLSMSF